MARSESTLAIVGGGVFVAPLLRALALSPAMPRLRIRISARDHGRLEVIAAHARRLLEADAPDWEVHACKSVREAASGAKAVVLLARIGGAPARAHDETFPREFGWVGDEGLGLGGLANAWRTLPVLEGLGNHLLEAAPGALVLNLIAPLPLTTRLLSEQGLRAIGVCELPTTMDRRLSCGERLEYLGLNHLGWFWPSTSGQEWIFSRAIELGCVHAETVARYRAIPLPYYYRVLRPDLGRDMGIERPLGRAQELFSLSERIFRRMLDPTECEIPELDLRSTPWFDRAVVPILASLWLGTAFQGFVTGGGADRAVPLEGLPAEYRARFDGSRIDPDLPSRIPGPVRAFLEESARSMNRSYRACRSRDLADLELAVATLCPELPHHRLKDAVDAVRSRVFADVIHSATPARRLS